MKQAFFKNGICISKLTRESQIVLLGDGSYTLVNKVYEQKNLLSKNRIMLSLANGSEIENNKVLGIENFIYDRKAPLNPETIEENSIVLFRDGEVHVIPCVFTYIDGEGAVLTHLFTDEVINYGEDLPELFEVMFSSLNTFNGGLPLCEIFTENLIFRMNSNKPIFNVIVSVTEFDVEVTEYLLKAKANNPILKGDLVKTTSGKVGVVEGIINNSQSSCFYSVNLNGKLFEFNEKSLTKQHKAKFIVGNDDIPFLVSKEDYVNLCLILQRSKKFYKILD